MPRREELSVSPPVFAFLFFPRVLLNVVFSDDGMSWRRTPRAVVKTVTAARQKSQMWGRDHTVPRAWVTAVRRSGLTCEEVKTGTMPFHPHYSPNAFVHFWRI